MKPTLVWEIMEYAQPVDRNCTGLPIIERAADHIWWMIYVQVKLGGYILLCAFGTLVMEVFIENPKAVPEDSEEDSDGGFVQIVIDIQSI